MTKTLRSILLADPAVPNAAVARRMVRQGRVSVDGVPVEDLDALDEPPAGPVRISTRRGKGRPVRPADAATVRRWLRVRAGWAEGDAVDWSEAERPERSDEITAYAVKRVAAMMSAALERPQADVDWNRHRVLEYVFGVRSTKDLHQQEAIALIAWLESDDGWTVPNATAAEECRRMLRAALEDAGQMAFDVGGAA